MRCIAPFKMTHKITGEHLTFPCGKCPTCVARRTSAWSFRLMQTDKVATSSYFVTLTYDTNHVPISKKGYMTLIKRDVQLFFKRLRKLNAVGIKYYAVGEYGGKSKRPHYHLILFNCDVKTIEAAWKLGQIHYGDVNGASIGYTLKYICKPSQIPMHQNDDRIPEFALMSKGLGENYLTPQMVDWHKQIPNERMYCNLTDGKKCSMPRYYKDKIYPESMRKDIARFFKALPEEEHEETTHQMVESHFAAFEAMRKSAIKSKI